VKGVVTVERCQGWSKPLEEELFLKIERIGKNPSFEFYLPQAGSPFEEEDYIG